MTDHLILGLGNPGAQYELTRHNAGFLAADYIADQLGWSLSSEKWHGLSCCGRLDGKRIFIVKPQTFMNRSGECAVRFAEFHRIELNRILVLHDDLDLAPGRIKIAAKGGAGGHNGIRSLIQHFGSQDFARLKIGIGRPEPGRQPVDRYVLSPFSEEELTVFNARLPLIQEAVDLFIRHGEEHCMNKMNGRTV
jgi:PTH1 family peptidyl-tRNA hydrolase